MSSARRATIDLGHFLLGGRVDHAPRWWGAGRAPTLCRYVAQRASAVSRGQGRRFRPGRCRVKGEVPDQAGAGDRSPRRGHRGGFGPAADAGPEAEGPEIADHVVEGMLRKTAVPEFGKMSVPLIPSRRRVAGRPIQIGPELSPVKGPGLGHPVALADHRFAQ